MLRSPGPKIQDARPSTQLGLGSVASSTGSRSACAFTKASGWTRTTLGIHRQTPEELAHYARACTDILFKFPFSKKDANGNVNELEGIAARSDFDLSQHARFSGKPMGVFDEELRAAWGKLPKEKADDLWRRYYENRKKYLVKMGVAEEQASRTPPMTRTASPKANTFRT
jgi:glycyl-tRNA synthetase (class II)